MRLSYSILWIENEHDWLEPTLEFAKGLIEENGFELIETVRSSEAEIEQMLQEQEPLKNFDLILVDFNLNKGDRGNKIIENIRTHNIYTDVIFYSQDPDAIREAIREHWLDGIYCSSRNRDEFEFKFEKVFLTTIKKIQHISSMRGLVLSETSQLDNKIEEIILGFLETKDEEQVQKLKKYIIKDLIQETAKTNNNKAQKIELTIDNKALLGHKLFDAYKKMRTAAKIIEILENPKLVTKDRFLEEYLVDVIEIRNDLAHANEVLDNGQNILLCTKGARSFTSEECIGVRKNLKKHSKYLDGISAFLLDV